MVSFSKARQIAEAWLDVKTDQKCQLIRELTEAKPYGWIFHYGLKSGEPAAGGGPFIVDRIDGEIRVLGTAQIKKRLAEYEHSLPEARMQMKPEEPKW